MDGGGSVCLVVAHVVVLVTLALYIHMRWTTVASHTRHGNTFAYPRPAALGRGQESVSKATIPACMTLGDMH